MDNTYQGFADASGSATAVVSPGPPASLTWVIAQFTIETEPFRPGSSAIIRRNGRLITSSSLGSSDSAYGPPAVAMNAGDTINCVWAGLTQGDEASLTIYFDEQPYGAHPSPDVVV